MMRECADGNCDRPARSRGLCEMHYTRVRRTERGTANPDHYSAVDPVQKIVDRCEIGLCWLWQRKRNNRGYGVTGFGGRRWYVHRLMWTHLVGPIPAGFEIDHLCKQRACCNPDHLEPVPGKVNTLRGGSPAARHARRTHCDEGHELNESRTCRICKNTRARELYAARREELENAS